jgi:hypothetical protein
MNTEALALKIRMGSSGGLSVRLRGNCKEPMLRAGDMARIVPAARAEVGRVYLLGLPGGGVALHRVIAACDGSLMSKGDRSSMYETLPEENIIGILAAVKFNENDSWHKFKEQDFLRRIVVILSKHSIYDKGLGKEGRIHGVVRLMCKKILVFLSWHRRRRWEKPQARVKPTG